MNSWMVVVVSLRKTIRSLRVGEVDAVIDVHGEDFPGETFRVMKEKTNGNL